MVVNRLPGRLICSVPGRVDAFRKESTLNGGQPPSGKIDLFSSWSGRRFPEGVYVEWWSTAFNLTLDKHPIL